MVRHDRIGDVVISTPLFNLIRARFPDATIGILLGRKNRASHALLQGVDLVHHLDPTVIGYSSTASELRGNRYDVVINLLAKDSASGALLSVLSGATYRIGFVGEAASIYDRAVEHSSAPSHIVSETSRLLAPLGIPTIGAAPATDREKLTLRISPELLQQGSEWWRRNGGDDATDRVVVNISASAPSKLWSDDQTRLLLDQLREQGCVVAAASAPEDRERLERITSSRSHIALPATSSLAEYCGMLAHSTIVVTPDTSVVHFAAALGRPVVMLSAAAAAATWYPWGVPYRIVGTGLESIDAVPASIVADAVNSLRIEIDRPLGASPLI